MGLHVFHRFQGTSPFIAYGQCLVLTICILPVILLIIILLIRHFRFCRCLWKAHLGVLKAI